jgi:hypothetical protein
MLSIQQYAARVGRTSAEMRAGAGAFHLAYISGTPEQRADLQHRWMLGHLQGEVKAKAITGEPERILSRGKGKGASKAHISAIDRAYSSFRYCVIRPEKKAKKAEPKAHTRISREARTMAKALIDLCGSVAAAKAALTAV